MNLNPMKHLNHFTAQCAAFTRLVYLTCLLSFVFAPLSSIAQVPSYVPTSGLVGWWPFNGNANDESGNGNNGTVNGATLTTDRFGVANKAYSFNGSSNYIDYPSGSSSSLNIVGDFTVCFWVKTSSIGSTGKTIISFGDQQNSNSGGITIGINDGFPLGPYGRLGYATQGQWNQSTNVINDNVWHFIVITLQGSLMKLYVDNNLNNQTLNQLPTLSWNGGRRVGAANYGLVGFYKDLLDDIAIYNRALTHQEITNLYTSSAPPSITTTASPSSINCGETATLTASSASGVQSCVKAELPATLQNGLVGYWPFCGNANDASGNGNNGTVNGAILATDRFGNASSGYSFNGTTNFISIPNSLFTNGPFSFTAWYKISDLSHFNPLVSFGELGANQLSKMYIEPDYGNTPKPAIGTAGANDITSTSSSCLTNTWQMLTVTFTNYSVNNVSFYLNGQYLGSNTTAGANVPAPFNNSGFTFGKHLVNSIGGYFQGQMDDLIIHNRILSPSEIQQLYNLGNVSYSWSTGATTSSITVTPAQTSTYTCTATNAAGSTTSSVTVAVADTITWTGAVDTDWHKPCNWSPQFVPKCCNNVAVPLTTNQPIVSGVAAAEDLTIYTTNGAQLTVNNGANLQIATCPTAITTTACPSLAVITTTSVSSITQTTAVSGGSITYQGASAITARGICWGTSPNPTIANSLTSNGTGIGTFTSNLTGLVAGITCYVRAYATNGSGTSYGNQVSFVAVNPQPAYPTNSVFCASGPTLVVDVTSPTGKTWMDRNLGATQVAASSTDAAAYGDLYQWGRGNDGHQCRTSATTTTLSSSDQPGNGNFILSPNAPNDWRSPQNDNLWQGVNGVNNPCPSGYRIATYTELNNERLSWSSNNNVGAYNSPLKLPYSGGRDAITGQVNTVLGYLWSSTISGVNSQTIDFSNVNAYQWNSVRGQGCTVRCIKN
jgi:hypothetical protein